MKDFDCSAQNSCMSYLQGCRYRYPPVHLRPSAASIRAKCFPCSSQGLPVIATFRGPYRSDYISYRNRNFAGINKIVAKQLTIYCRLLWILTSGVLRKMFDGLMELFFFLALLRILCFLVSRSN